SHGMIVQHRSLTVNTPVAIVRNYSIILIQSAGGHNGHECGNPSTRRRIVRRSAEAIQKGLQ
ncbi:MAG: hypothetical protein V1685_04700, partial [Parcubacteria group bacterium]